MTSGNLMVRMAGPASLALLLMGLLALHGCSDSSAPAPEVMGEGEAEFEGSVDLDAATFVLQRLETPDPLGRALELVGQNLTVDADSAWVMIDVAVRNSSTETIGAPLRVDVGRFRPRNVTLLNADGEYPEPDEESPRWLPFYFDYSESLGDDGMLEPDETSAFRMWKFLVPDLESFSFVARARFELDPGAVLAGFLFEDHDRDGRYDPEEDDRLEMGWVTIQGPDDLDVTLQVDERGRYRLELEATGLYTVTADPGVDCPVLYTTPNPLEVLIVPDDEGNPQGFVHAHFGMVICPDDHPDWPPPEPAHLTRQDLDEVQGDDYDLYGMRLTGNILRMEVGYGGCQPRHPLRLLVSAHFRLPGDDDEEGKDGDDDPEELPTTWMVLQHDDLGEDCEAYFERRVAFHLGAVRRFVREEFGPGQRVRLVLVTPDGDRHPVVFGP